MSISSRGHNRTLVIDNCAVPISEMFESILNFNDITEIRKRYPCTVEEIFEGADACLDLNPITDEDFITFKCIPSEDDGDGPEYELTTDSVSDRVYIGVIVHARDFYPDIDDLDTLYVEGLFLIMSECINDLLRGEAYFKSSELHDIVYKGFEEAFPDNVMESLQKLSENFNLEDRRWKQ